MQSQRKGVQKQRGTLQGGMYHIPTSIIQKKKKKILGVFISGVQCYMN